MCYCQKAQGLQKKTVRKQWLEDLVVNQTMQLVKDDAAMESIIAKVMELQNKENTNIPLYEKQLRDAESGIQNMLNAIQAGILTSSGGAAPARIAEEKLTEATDRDLWRSDRSCIRGKWFGFGLLYCTRKCREIERFHGFFVL